MNFTFLNGKVLNFWWPSSPTVPLLNWHRIRAFEAKIRWKCLQNFCSHTQRKYWIHALTKAWESHSISTKTNKQTHFDPAPISPSHTSLRGAGKHTPAADKTLWSLNNSLEEEEKKATRQTKQPTRSQSTHGCVFARHAADGEKAVGLYTPSCYVLSCFPQSSLFFFKFSSPRCVWHHSRARSASCDHQWKEEHDTDRSPTHRPQKSSK